MTPKQFLMRFAAHLMAQYGRLYPLASYVAPEEAITRMANEVLFLRARLAATQEKKVPTL